MNMIFYHKIILETITSFTLENQLKNIQGKLFNFQQYQKSVSLLGKRDQFNSVIISSDS